MRVLYVSRGLGSPKYGAERISKLIKLHLETEIDLFSITDDKTFEGKGEIFFNPTYSFKIPFFEYVFYRFFGKRKLRKVCRRIKPDLILSSVYSGYAIPTPKNIKTIILFQDEPGFYVKDDLSPFLISLLFRIWYKTIQYFKKKVIKERYFYLSISENMTRSLIRLGASAEKILTLPYGSFSNYTESQSNEEEWQIYQNSHQLKDNDFLLLFVGALYYTKGIHTIVEALKIVNKKNIKLLIAGSEMPFFGKFYTNEIKKRIREYEIQDQIKWLGYVDNKTITTLYNRSSALLSASYSEGCQLTLIEAAHYNLPIIASRVGSAVEQFTGYAKFFNAGNERELVDIILKMYDSKTKKVDYEIYSFEEGFDRVLNWFESLVKIDIGERGVRK